MRIWHHPSEIPDTPLQSYGFILDDHPDEVFYYDTVHHEFFGNIIHHVNNCNWVSIKELLDLKMLL